MPASRSKLVHSLPTADRILLEWARFYQRLFPFYSWAYGVEARHSENERDRLKALAITLYLDAHSERASGFSRDEKQKAIEWLEKFNPFLDTLHKKKGF